MTIDNFIITDKEDRLLTLVAKHESKSSGNYIAVFPSERDPEIVEKTITQVFQYQRYRFDVLKKGGTAIGRYQFIYKTLKIVVNDYAGWTEEQQNRIRFTPDVQDYLIILRLKDFRNMNDWLAGKLPSIDFQLELAKEFASVPSPYNLTKTVKGKTIQVEKGKTYYPETGNNKAGFHDVTFSEELDAILKGVDYQSRSLDVGPGTKSGAHPEQGTSNKRVTEYATAGGNRPTGGHRTSSNPNLQIGLPTPENVYEDEPIDPHDNRYDFRTGKMVRDIGINGTYPVASNPYYTDREVQSPGVAAGPDVNGNYSDTTSEVASELTGVDTGIRATRSGSFGDGLRGAASNIDTTIDSRVARTNSPSQPSNPPTGTSGSSARKATRSTSSTSSTSSVSSGSSSRAQSRAQPIPKTPTTPTSTVSSGSSSRRQSRKPIPPGNTKILRPR